MARPSWSRWLSPDGAAVLEAPSEPGDAALLEVRRITKRFGGLVAVNAVDLDIAKGSVTSVIGPNGAGKTTLFNLIAGLYRPSEGSMRLLGRELAGRPTHEITRLGVA